MQRKMADRRTVRNVPFFLTILMYFFNLNSVFSQTSDERSFKVIQMATLTVANSPTMFLGPGFYLSGYTVYMLP